MARGLKCRCQHMITDQHRLQLRQVIGEQFENKLTFSDGFLAVGDLYNVNAELYDFGTSAWTTTADYPFAASWYFIVYDMVYIPEIQSYLVIGGMSAGDMSQIAKLSDGQWSDMGHLNSARNVSYTRFHLLLNYCFNC